MHSAHVALPPKILSDVIGNAKVTEDGVRGRSKENVPAIRDEMAFPISSREERGTELHIPALTNSH